MVTKFFILLKIILYFINRPSAFNKKFFYFCLKTKLSKKIFISCSDLALYILFQNNCFYTQLALFFHLLEDFYIADEDIDDFFFCLRKISILFTTIFSLFDFFFLRKILIPFMSLFSKPFFVLFFLLSFFFWFFDNIVSTFTYI